MCYIIFSRLGRSRLLKWFLICCVNYETHKKRPGDVNTKSKQRRYQNHLADDTSINNKRWNEAYSQCLMNGTLNEMGISEVPRQCDTLCVHVRWCKDNYVNNRGLHNPGTIVFQHICSLWTGRRCQRFLCLVFILRSSWWTGHYSSLGLFLQ